MSTTSSHPSACKPAGDVDTTQANQLCCVCRLTLIHRETLTAAIEAGGFLEHAMVHGNLYGTSFDAIRRVQQASKICILDIDVQVRRCFTPRRCSIRRVTSHGCV